MAGTPGSGISLWSIGLATVGGFFLWSAVQNPQGGPVQVFRDILAGKMPTPGVQTDSRFDATLEALKAAMNAGGGQGETPPASGAASGLRGKVMATANQYLGSGYRWGGTSKSGIDCSGLVLQAYASIGVKMSHDATSQTRKGKKITEAQAQPGDLIAWGSPIRYPHIALYVSPGKQMDAPTYGQVVAVRSIYKNLHGSGPQFFNVIDNLPGAK